MLDHSRARSRRALLGGGLGGLVALVATRLGRPDRVLAEGETMHVGGDHLTATTATQLKNTTTDNDVMILQTTRGGRALYARSTTGYAIEARSSAGDGINAITTNSGGSAVIGRNEEHGTRGILADPVAGVRGYGSEIAVWGISADGAGVLGTATEDGYGVWGRSVRGTAVRAQSDPTGIALRVIGRASFTRSGIATIPAGSDRIDVPVAPLSDASFALATMQQYRQGVHIASASSKPAESKVTIRLSGIVATDTKVAWQVLDTA